MRRGFVFNSYVLLIISLFGGTFCSVLCWSSSTDAVVLFMFDCGVYPSSGILHSPYFGTLHPFSTALLDTVIFVLFISTIPASGVDLIITILCKISITVSASLLLLGLCLVLLVKMMDVIWIERSYV